MVMLAEPCVSSLPSQPKPACRELIELLTEVSPELMEEVAGEFFAANTRNVLHESKRVRVLESRMGSPPVHSR